MRRSVSVGVFYILGGGYIAYGKQGSSLAACLFLALIAFVRESKKFPSWWLKYSSNCKFVTKEESAQMLLQTPWHLMKAHINLISL